MTDKQVTRGHKCPVCLNVQSNLMSANCGHAVCNACWDQKPNAYTLGEFPSLENLRHFGGVTAYRQVKSCPVCFANGFWHPLYLNIC